LPVTCFQNNFFLSFGNEYVYTSMVGRIGEEETYVGDMFIDEALVCFV
jgi:hypothetical protein